jgi:predicted phosphate transport protein (TIGR00153 family)
VFFSKLLPRDTQYFELLQEHAGYIVTAAKAFSNLVENYADLELRERYHDEVNAAEAAADSVTLAVNQAIHKTFITPIDREQIHRLINTMDDVADLIQDTAETMWLYDVRHTTEEIKVLTNLSVRCCERVGNAVGLLSQAGDPKTAEAALKTCDEIDKLEDDADRVMRKAMSVLFRQEPDVREVIKLKTMYELLENITDRCEDVANLVEGVILDLS